ncbi:MAG: type II secretion system protein N [Giesbergeria sp.]
MAHSTFIKNTRPTAAGALRRAASASTAARAPWGWAVAGALLGGCAALLTSLPAQWLASGLATATHGHLQLVAARGSVWDGSAQLLLTGGSDSQSAAALPGRLRWQVRPTWQGLRANFYADCCTVSAPLQLQVQPRFGGVRVEVTDGETRWPATVLTGLGTPWNTLQLQGQLALQTRGFSAETVRGRLVLGGAVQLDALAVSSRLSTLRPMGSYRLALAGGEAPTLQLSTLSGALELSGSGQWVGERLRFSGEAQAAPGREPALSNLLNIIGRRVGARSLISLG